MTDIKPIDTFRALDGNSSSSKGSGGSFVERALNAVREAGKDAGSSERSERSERSDSDASRGRSEVEKAADRYENPEHRAIVTGMEKAKEGARDLGTKVKDGVKREIDRERQELEEEVEIVRGAVDKGVDNVRKAYGDSYEEARDGVKSAKDEAVSGYGGIWADFKRDFDDATSDGNKDHRFVLGGYEILKHGFQAPDHIGDVTEDVAEEVGKGLFSSVTKLPEVRQGVALVKGVGSMVGNAKDSYDEANDEYEQVLDANEERSDAQGAENREEIGGAFKDLWRKPMSVFDEASDRYDEATSEGSGDHKFVLGLYEGTRGVLSVGESVLEGPMLLAGELGEGAGESIATEARNHYESAKGGLEATGSFFKGLVS